MPFTAEEIEIIHKLPLRKTVRWIDMSAMFPGVIIEETKRKFDEGNPGDPAAGKWGAVNVRHPDCAANIVAIHNEWLASQPRAVREANEPQERMRSEEATGAVHPGENDDDLEL